MKHTYHLFSCRSFSDPIDEFEARSLHEAADICCRKYRKFRPVRSTRTSVEYALCNGKTILDTFRLEEK